MEQVELEQIIERARLARSSELRLSNREITSLPESIGNLSNLTNLYLRGNQLTSLPESIGNLANLTKLNLGENRLIMLPDIIGNLHSLNKLGLDNNQLISLPESISNISNLTSLRLNNNQLTSLPESIGNLFNLHLLCLDNNQLISLPESIGNFSNLITLDLNSNQLVSLPESVGNLSHLTWLGLGKNQLISLPESICNLSNLNTLNIEKNPYVDLSNLQKIPNLEGVHFFSVRLSRRYWNKLSEWKCEWLLDEENYEIRRVLIEQLGYDKICRNLNAVTLDIWREYTLLKIDGIEKIYSEDSLDDEEPEPIGTEPMVLLKMTCPSTSHIHILRVPPEMMSAEAAITWVNHGIHPDEFAIQT